jgi:hypothetical protein
MEEIGRKTKVTQPPKPCKYFDLIGGTSTGGLIAIMLGRLGMVFSQVTGLTIRLYRSALMNTSNFLRMYSKLTRSSREVSPSVTMNVVSIMQT